MGGKKGGRYLAAPSLLRGGRYNLILAERWLITASHGEMGEGDLALLPNLH
jgi:hypothetical protein